MMSRTLTVISLITVWHLSTDPACSEQSYTFRNILNNIAVAEQYVLVATENCLYKFDHMLHLLSETSAVNATECRKSTKGTSMNTTSVYYNILLLIYNGTVLSCWNQDGICIERELNNLKNITTSTAKVVHCDPKHPGVGFLLATKKFYLAVALYTGQAENCWPSAKNDIRPISLKSKSQNGNLITDKPGASVLLKENAKDLNFVDGFLLQDYLVFIYYPSHPVDARMVIIPEDEELSFHSKYSLMCGSKSQNRAVILSAIKFSALGNDFWAGIFTSPSISLTTEKTALCIYSLNNITQFSNKCFLEDFNHGDPESCDTNILLPINQTATLSHGNLSAVYAVEVNKRMVFFLGTESGQLLKVTLDSNWKASCPEVIYEFSNENPVFRTIREDPVNNSYVYVATVNEIKRVKVANCERFESCKECLSALDPYCGWCHSQKRCTLNTECDSSVAQDNWAGIAEDGNCMEVNAVPISNTQVKITATGSTGLNQVNWRCVFQNMNTGAVLCNKTLRENPINCSCVISTNMLFDKDHFSVILEGNNKSLSENFQFEKCSTLQNGCLECVKSGCLWCTKDSECRSPLNPCKDYDSTTTCKKLGEKIPAYKIDVNLVQPERISYLGKERVTIMGQNFKNISSLVLIGTSSCKTEKVKVLSNSNTQAIISLPKSHKETKGLCLDFDGTNCHQAKNIYYLSLPSCAQISPNISWSRGGRNISIYGNNIDLLDKLMLLHKNIQQNYTFECSESLSRCSFPAPTLMKINQTIDMYMEVQKQLIWCGRLQYDNDPTFLHFSVLSDMDEELDLRIRKTRDSLNIQENELQVIVHYKNNTDQCKVQNITHTTVFCKVRKTSKEKINEAKMKVTVILGNFTQELEITKEWTQFLYILVVPLLIIVIIAAYFVTRYKAKQLSNRLSQQVEMLECQIRQEIRDGFAELQMDEMDVAVQTPAIIFFFDYKHFALKTLFPESQQGKTDLCETIPSPFQTRRSSKDENILSILKKIFENKRFLVNLIHTLENQSNFSVKDRCMFASFLAICFQNNLVYLTELMEDLIRDLMDQSSNKHPKLMLRRTESVVEKLLTNWMSTCLYGYLRESVGEHLFQLVNTINQRIHKGPIDAVTCKALYTLNEDWLLWQMTEFKSLELNVCFKMVLGNEEEEDASKNIKATVLDCDTIGQAKEKILQTFFNIKGYVFGLSLSDIGLELHHGQAYQALSDIDSSSVVLENGIKMLNTIKHYKIENGATINVIQKKNCDIPDIDNPDLYCHLVLPEDEQCNDSQNIETKGKQHLKVKELYLTKLLSTKVAIHTAVEKLFRSIWTIPHHKPPIPIKYFFDFLDSQAENKKITDPEVLHIWKTNSLPLRFWINILKNPQFVFDIKKTPLLDSCLSVIAQAFMDGFSLVEQHLGKSAPTNKLLYAKDIPMFREEVKAYYKDIRDAPPVSHAELKEFLTQESKKHEHEFKEDVPLLELYKYIEKYFEEVMSTLKRDAGFEVEREQLLLLKSLFKEKKSCSWEEVQE
ncbi:plexin-C1 [Spea bombifrons]|uniref:plexin-C1 n=1 Tax=Spea bombifrons TaxID=233779 RepID=UPI00234B259E|nr:plexin-C1 [Spea bombifrons]